MKNLILCTLLAFMTLYSQTYDSTGKGKLQIRSVQVQLGSLRNIMDSRFSIEDFRTLAPQSTFLQNDLTQFQKNSYYYYAFHIPALSLDLGLWRNNTQKRKIEYLLGIAYMNGVTVGSSLIRKIKVIDKTYVNPDGEQVDHFKEARDHYNIGHRSHMINLKATILYHTSKEKNIYFGIGAEVSGGMAFGAKTQVVFQTDTLEGYHANGLDYYSKHNNPKYRIYQKVEEFSNKSGWTAAIALPITVNLHLKKFKLLKNIHPYYEFKPIYRAFNVSEVHAVGFLRLQHSYGIKVEW